eukprot:jgi/Tetstr1/447569/TSEL_034947.t2
MAAAKLPLLAHTTSRFARRSLYAALVLLACLHGTASRELSSRENVREGFAPVEYTDCKSIVTMDDIMATCGHLINPSGLVYQPSIGKLYAVGQEYIMHLNETRTDIGDYEYHISGCYKGSELSLGRGDAEAAAGLDFDLPEPDRDDRRWHKNWRILSNLKHYIMTVEENYAEPVVYLVDTTKLGDDWSLPAVCNDFEAHFSVEIDMMEFDPTFKVQDGAYGALLVGSEQNNAAVYVDPYLVEQGKDNDVTLTEPFELLSGAVDGIPMNGIEGIQIFDNRIFFAIDRNSPRTQGVVTCKFTKPKSMARRTHGWHTAAPTSAVFAMGCFWCGEEALQKLPGVLCAESGYAGGDVVCPTYYQVVREDTGHLEVVRVVYDDAVLDYETLLGFFWHNVNPLQNDGQFCDRGASYRSAIFYDGPEQQQAALDSKAAFEAANSWTILTEVLPLGTFYVAESNHQNYFLTNPTSYTRYKTGCRRESILKAVWGTDAYDEFHQNTVPLSADEETCSLLSDGRVLVDVCSIGGTTTGGSGGARTGASSGSTTVGSSGSITGVSPNNEEEDMGESNASDASGGSQVPGMLLLAVAGIAGALLPALA